jgi:hypothetical protein
MCESGDDRAQIKDAAKYLYQLLYSQLCHLRALMWRISVLLQSDFQSHSNENLAVTRYLASNFGRIAP